MQVHDQEQIDSLDQRLEAVEGRLYELIQRLEVLELKLPDSP